MMPTPNGMKLVALRLIPPVPIAALLPMVVLLTFSFMMAQFLAIWALMMS